MTRAPPDAPPLVLDAAGATADLTRGSVHFVGNATVLLRYAGFTILTDPNFLHKGDHVHLGYGLVAKRLTEPALELAALPPLDFVLLSHYHGDHFDPTVEAGLDRDVPILSTPHAVRGLRKLGFRRTHALERWQRMRVTKGDAALDVTAMPARHGPPVVARLLPETMGSLLDFRRADGSRALRVYVSGDTLVHDDIREIPRRFPDIDLALLHLGGTRALGVLVTMDAEQALEMVRIVDPRTFIPIHYNDYSVFKSPIEDFVRAAEEAGLAERMRYLAHGQTHAFEVPPPEAQPDGARSPSARDGQHPGDA